MMPDLQLKSNLDDRLNDFVFCALDLETTGSNPIFHHIVEAGIIKFNRGGIIDRFESLVNPGVPIPRDVIHIHGITDNMVKSAPPIEDILGSISSFIAGSFLVIQNPAFDLSFLLRMYRENNIAMPDLKAFDTVRLSRTAYPKLPSHKLEALCNFFGINVMNHRALSDAFACREVFVKVLEKIDPDGMWTMADLIKFHGPMIGPGIRTKSRARRGAAIGLMVGKKSRIRYEDFDGIITTRDIMPVEFIKYGKRSYMVAHCFMRNADRFFKIDRILEVR